MLYSQVVLLGVLAIAMITDIKTGKIKNWLTLPAIIIGPFIHLAQGQNHLATLSLAGMGVMLVAAAILISFGIVGGGDAKLLVAIGSLAGLSLVKNILLFTALSGGVFAILVLFKRKGIANTTKQLALTAWLKIGLKANGTEIDGGKIKLPYSVPIAIGTIAALLWRP